MRTLILFSFFISILFLSISYAQQPAQQVTIPGYSPRGPDSTPPPPLAQPSAPPAVMQPVLPASQPPPPAVPSPDQPANVAPDLIQKTGNTSNAAPAQSNPLEYRQFETTSMMTAAPVRSQISRSDAMKTAVTIQTQTKVVKPMKNNPAQSQLRQSNSMMNVAP